MSSTSRSRREPWDLLCFSHLRWDSVFQRPHHLMTRCAAHERVFFIEEPCPVAGEPAMTITSAAPNLHIVTPHLPVQLEFDAQNLLLEALLRRFLRSERVERYVAWYYTPMAVGFTRHLEPAAVVYDCMDELSAFLGAPPPLLKLETELLARADVVFTGGQSLYEAKRDRHDNAHAFPSSIDAPHFARARVRAAEPEDQSRIRGPRVGFAGVIDERMDLDLLRGTAEARPDWQFVMLGPVVKIDRATLPSLPNIHYLGQKPYADLPAYLSGWDVAWLPFARNEATRFISPTKTPEYLAAGCPVVSTSIRDVVRPYGQLELVSIADTPADSVAAMERAMQEGEAREFRLARVDAFLADFSWDKTWNAMMGHVEEGILHRMNGRGTLSRSPKADAARFRESDVARIVRIAEGAR